MNAILPLAAAGVGHNGGPSLQALSAPHQAERLIRQCEGCRLLPYRDSGGIPTIGIGATRRLDGSPVTMWMPPITQDEADAMCLRDLGNAAHAVDAYVHVPLNDNQKAALTSFVFNVGLGERGARDGLVWLRSGRQSQLLTKLNAGNYAGAADELLDFNRAAGVVVAGLTHRRQLERAVFLGLVTIGDGVIPLPPAVA